MADVEWKFRGGYMFSNHGVMTAHADEAVDDADAVWFDPDPKSKSAETIRVIGYSYSRDHILTIILLPTDRVPPHDSNGISTKFIGVNGWPSNSTERRIYREANA